MMKAAVVLLSILLLAGAAFGAEAKDVTYKSGDETIHGVLYTPSGKGKLPAMVVIHEWWGLNDWPKQQASKLADEGYVTLAVDLYRGKIAKSSDEAHELSRGLPQDRAIRDLLAATSYLRSLPNVDPARIGSIGWCMGGGYSLDLAINDPKLKAAIVNYGHLATETETLGRINASVLGIFGGQDRGIPVDSVRAFEQALKKQGKKAEIKIYPDAGHAFENENNKNGYRAADAQDAWKTTLEFLKENI